jgi:transcriptional regulator with XRE-family HTH domain
MVGVGNPTARRRELGVLLRTLRHEHQWTVDYVAERLMCSPSKVSRMETGDRGARPRDVRDLCDLYGVDDEKRQRLMTLAIQGKQRAAWQPLGLPYSTYVGLEAEAATISDFGLGILPGLLQTTDYAREVVRVVLPHLSAEEAEQRVSGRITRQRVLTSASPPQFQAIVDESVLHRVVGSPAIMQAQLEHLLEVSDLDNVTIRVIRYEAGALPASNNKFIILSFASMLIPDVVFVEGLTDDLYLDDAHDIEVYSEAFGALRQLSDSPEKTREVIADKVARYRSLSR